MGATKFAYYVRILVFLLNSATQRLHPSAPLVLMQFTAEPHPGGEACLHTPAPPSFTATFGNLWGRGGSGYLILTDTGSHLLVRSPQKSSNMSTPPSGGTQVSEHSRTIQKVRCNSRMRSRRLAVSIGSHCCGNEIV